jgi:hypothetical protein
MANNKATFSFEDYVEGKKGEAATMSINIGPITELNLLAKRAAVDALYTATLPLIRGRIRTISYNDIFVKETAAVANTDAQRENKWLIAYRDVTEYLDAGNTIQNTGYNRVFKYELPTAHINHASFDGEKLNLNDAGEVAAFVTAFEAAAQSPTGGNDIEVVSITYVGRNA